VGSGAEPQPESNLVHFRLKMWHLMAIISMIFHIIKCLDFVQFGVSYTIYWLILDFYCLPP